MISLGGTISMTEAPSGGVVPTLSGEALLRRLGLGMADIEVSPVSLMQVASAQLSPEDLVGLAARVEEEIAAGASGIVVTQGTDTIEETAFALDLLAPRKVPVVVTGAMRHPDAPGADGAANLLDALAVAASRSATAMGPMVVMDGQIHAARFVHKWQTTTVGAFRSSPAGQIGWVKEGEVILGLSPPTLAGSGISVAAGPLPKVGLLKAFIGDDGRLAQVLVSLGYQGVVVEGMGAGHTSPALADRLADIASRIPVIVSTRATGGHVLKRTYGFPGSEIDLQRKGVLLAGWLHTAKAHLLLTFMLAAKKNREDIRSVLRQFDGG